MISYLIKVTAIWLLLLLLFELFYKKNAYYRTNRFYLLFSLLAGMLIPMLPVPGIIPVQTGAAIAGMLPDMATVPVQQAQPSQISQAPSATFRYDLAFLWLYVAGAAVMLFVSLKEVVLILRKAIYGHYQTIQGHKVFRTGREHAPFSFMGWIFISRPDQYSAEEMNFILEHEDAHNRQKHWLDIILMQLITIAFWFHPLVWRARHLLKLTHEYEADALAAGGNAHDYGHFLIQQTLLKGTPSIAHSFHYSPLKNRIDMLTRNRNQSKGWKYFIAIPALLGCTMLMAKSANMYQRIRVGDKSTFMGNEFQWSPGAIDSINVMDPVTNKVTWLVMRKAEGIIVANKKQVFVTDDLTLQPQFRSGTKDFGQYLKDELMAATRIPDSIAQIQINNLVVDEKGKAIYYDVHYINTTVTNTAGMHLSHPLLDPIIDKIIGNSPLWMPGVKEGKAVPVYMQSGGAMSFKNVSATHTFTGRVTEGTSVNGDKIIQSDSITVTMPK